MIERSNYSRSNKPTMRRFIPILTAAVTLAGAGTAAAKTHHHTAPCRIPNLKGDTIVQARHKLARADCKLGKINRPKVANGALKISSQMPRAGQRRAHGTKIRIWLKVKAHNTITAPAPAPTYTTSVDPTFTQDPTNPLAVTYTYDADAVESANGNTQNLGLTGQLPPGILNFYSQGSLVCSMNVGGSVYSGSCLVTYPAVGTYTVETQYIPNAATAVTQTEQETIVAQPTTTTLAVAFGQPFNVTGPPPTYQQSTNWFDGFAADYTSGHASAFTLTLTDQTTGQVQVGTSSVPTGSGCALEFVQVSGSSTISINPGCGLAGISFTDTDVISVTATTPATGGFLGSTSGSTTIWN